MSVQAQVPNDHPLMIAWNAYKATDDYANTRKWAVYPEHVEGSLWAAFSQGFASLEAENARLRERHLDAAINAGDAYVAAEKRAETAEAQLAEARRALGFFASVIMSGEPWTEVCEQRYRAALAPAEKPGSDGPDTDYDPSRDM